MNIKEAISVIYNKDYETAEDLQVAAEAVADFIADLTEEVEDLMIKNSYANDGVDFGKNVAYTKVYGLLTEG